MGILYERKQTAKIVLARVLLLLLIVSFILLMIGEYREYCILIVVFTLFLIIPTVTELKIFNNEVEIKIYYCLACVCRTHLLKPKETLRIFPYQIELEPNPDEGALFVGTFFTSTLLVKHYKIIYVGNGSEKKFSIRLTENEFKKIVTILN
jgi:hypothetical protein